MRLALETNWQSKEPILLLFQPTFSGPIEFVLATERPGQRDGNHSISVATWRVRLDWAEIIA